MSAVDLNRQIAILAPSVDPKAALRLGETYSAEITARDPNPHDAESCRLLSLAATEQDPPDFALATQWRDRALDLFTRIGWYEGIAAVLMAKAFIALAKRNDDFPRGKTLDVIEGSEDAVDLMDEILPFLQRDPTGITVGELSPSHAVLSRWYHEKRGFFLLALDRVGEARESYELAAEAAAGNPRGTVKVRLGRALVDYVAGSHDTALPDTRNAVDDARRLGPGSQDLVEYGERNIAVMEEDGHDLRPYEIL